MLAGILLMAPAIYAAPLQETVRLSERGEWQEFEIARDEVHRGRASQRLQAALRSVAEVRAAATGGDLVLYPKGGPRNETTRRYATRQVAVQLAPGVDIAPIAFRAQGRVVRALGKTQRWFLLETSVDPGSALEAAETLRRLPGVLAVEPQLARQRERRVTIPNDPLFPQQWHLRNTGQGGGATGIDVNVVNVWDNFRGAGVTVAIVDDGLEHSHPDLAPNYDPALSFDFNFRDPDPQPPKFNFDDHGTACAGLVAARGFNSRGIVGVAFEAKLSGLRLISRPTTDADEAEAFGFRNDAIAIKSNSWGPTDNARLLEGAGPLSIMAFQEAVLDGRGGLGTIFVWAGGNGGKVGDNSNYDGYANRPEALTIGAIGNNGLLADYSEQGANLLAVAPSSGGTLDVVTTDRKGEDGFNFSGNRSDPVSDHDYTGEFGGTSAAAPIAAGVIALILEANPQLGWRDVREILIRTAKKVNATDPGWADNGAGFHFNHKFGAGLIDAGAAVALAQTWENLGARIFAVREERYGAEIIPDNNAAGVAHTFTFNENALRVEHVSVTVDIRHRRRGQVRIEIESPSGMKSILAPGRARDIGKNLRDWTFTSVRHWGEMAAGDWKVRVIDQTNKVVGTLVSLKVELSGSELPLPLAAAGATLTAEEIADGDFQAGETVTAEFALKNTTGAPIIGVVATLLADGGVLNPSAVQTFGTIAPGATVSRPFTFTVGARPGETFRAMLAVTSDAGTQGHAIFKLLAGRRPAAPLRFVRNGLIAIPATGTAGNASAYPGVITIHPFGLPPGAVPVVTKVSVTLRGFSHGRSEDVDALLVHASSGRRVMLISDAGAGVVSNLNLTFDDDATRVLGNTTLTSGTFRPKNLGSKLDPFPGAPRAPYGSSLSVFNGLIATDQWLLYIRDDQAGAIGTISGWELTIDYAY